MNLTQEECYAEHRAALEAGASKLVLKVLGMEAHRNYYAQYVTRDLPAWVASRIGTEALLNSKDPHFNDISLRYWDSLNGAARGYLPKGNRSDASCVCLMKEAAKQWVESRKAALAETRVTP